jgi:predicted dehydrogenase
MTAPLDSGPSHAPVRVALVGCGAVAGMYHAPALLEGQKLGLARVTHLVDPSPERVAALRAKFPSAISLATHADLDGSVDLAIVASPVRFHAAQTIELLERGVHVLCEKPVARTAAEAATMAAAATAARRVLAVGMYKRFFPAVEWIGQVIRSGMLGRLRSFHLDEGGRFGWPAVTASFFDREQAGGGVTLDIGVHMLDIALHWLGEPASFVYEDDAYGGVECNARGTLRYRDGVEGTFQVSWDVPLSGTYALDFERGWIRWPTNAAHAVNVSIDGVTHGWEARLAAADRRLPRGLLHPVHGYVAAFTAQLQDVVGAIREHRPPRVDAAAGSWALGWIERMYAERRVLIPPHFTAAERERALELARGAR